MRVGLLMLYIRIVVVALPPSLKVVSLKLLAMNVVSPNFAAMYIVRLFMFLRSFRVYSDGLWRLAAVLAKMSTGGFRRGGAARRPLELANARESI